MYAGSHGRKHGACPKCLLIPLCKNGRSGNDFSPLLSIFHLHVANVRSAIGGRDFLAESSLKPVVQRMQVEYICADLYT